MSNPIAIPLSDKADKREDWIEWKGGMNPCYPVNLVIAFNVRGQQNDDGTWPAPFVAFAEDVHWTHKNSPSDIVRFYVMEETRNVSFAALPDGGFVFLRGLGDQGNRISLSRDETFRLYEELGQRIEGAWRRDGYWFLSPLGDWHLRQFQEGRIRKGGIRFRLLAWLIKGALASFVIASLAAFLFLGSANAAPIVLTSHKEKTQTMQILDAHLISGQEIAVNVAEIQGAIAGPTVNDCWIIVGGTKFHLADIGFVQILSLINPPG